MELAMPHHGSLFRAVPDGERQELTPPSLAEMG